MTSSKHNLANQKQQLAAISEFANMGDSPRNWQAFRKRWLTLFPVELYVDSENEIHRNVERAKRPMVSDGEIYVLTTSGVEARSFKRTDDGKWVDYREPEILRLRRLLRDAWSGGPTASRSMEELLGLRTPAGESLDIQSSNVSADWRRGSIVFLPRNPFQAACYALLLKSNLATFCANPDCPAPYFVARRATQRYCSPDCLKPFQKQSKLDWWNREGKTRRAKASGKSHKRRKDSDGSRKTR
jgi:hypothetical protein